MKTNIHISLLVYLTLSVASRVYSHPFYSSVKPPYLEKKVNKDLGASEIDKSGNDYLFSENDNLFEGVEILSNDDFEFNQKRLSNLIKAKDEPLVIVNKKTMSNYQFFSEYAFKISMEESLIIRFYAEGLIGLEETDMLGGETGFRGLTAGVRLKSYTFNFSYESGNNDIKSVKIGLIYKLQ